MPLQQRSPASRPPLLTVLAEYLPPAALMLFFVRQCYEYALTHNFWLDDILSRLFLADPSLGHMLAANQDVINTTPPLYFLLGWLWFHLIGGSELSLHLLTSVLLCGAVGITWRLLRPRYGFLPALIGLYAGFSAPELRAQNCDVRFYTLFLLTSAFALLQYDRLTRGQENLRTVPQYALNYLAHASLVFTHSFGLLYSGCLALSHLLLCLSQKRRIDLRFLASIALSWLTFVVLWGRTFLHHMTAFRPYSWIPRPTLHDAITHFYINSRIVLVATVGALLLFAVSLLLQKQRKQEDGLTDASARLGNVAAPYSSSLNLPLAAGVLLAIPLPLIYVVSLVGPSCFLPRYFLPLSMAWGILIAFLWDTALVRLSPSGSNQESRVLKILNGALTVGTLGFLAFQLFAINRISAKIASTPGPPTAAAEAEFMLTQAGAPKNIPVVFTSNHTFNTSFYYAHKPSRYYYIIDRDYATHSGPGTPYNYVIELVQENVAEHYSDQNTVDVKTFLNNNNRFLVYDDNIGTNPGEPRWQDYRLASDPRFKVTPLPVLRQLSHVFSILLVEKK